MQHGHSDETTQANAAKSRAETTEVETPLFLQLTFSSEQRVVNYAAPLRRQSRSIWVMSLSTICWTS